MIIIIMIATFVPLFLISLLLLSGRGAFLISGYNMMSKEAKANYDEKALCRGVGKLLIVINLCLMILFIGIHLEADWLTVAGTAALLITSLSGIIYMNTGNRYLKEGVDKNNPALIRSNRFSKIVTVIVVLIFLGTIPLIFLGLREPTVNVTQSTVQIRGLYGVTFDISEISDLTLIDMTMRGIGPGRRTNGLSGIGDTLRGHFSSNELGTILLFVRSNSSPTIHIERDGARDIFISFSDNAETRRVYNELRAALR